MLVTIHAAKTNLSKLIEAALKGEEVIIARGATPVVKIVPVKPKNKFVIGDLDHLNIPLPDFFEPMSEEDLRLWEGDVPDNFLGPGESHPSRDDR